MSLSNWITLIYWLAVLGNPYLLMHLLVPLTKQFQGTSRIYWSLISLMNESFCKKLGFPWVSSRFSSQVAHPLGVIVVVLVEFCSS